MKELEGLSVDRCLKLANFGKIVKCSLHSEQIVTSLWATLGMNGESSKFLLLTGSN